MYPLGNVGGDKLTHAVSIKGKKADEILCVKNT